MKWVLLVTVIMVAIFVHFPFIDMEFSKLFYDEELGFVYKDHIIPKLLYGLNYWIFYTTFAVGGVCLGLWFFKKFFPRLNIREKCFLLTPREWLFILIAFAMGPGVIVHSVFKDNFGRARPHQTHHFGGTKKFSFPLFITDQCESNCSFVSGHASAGFFLVSFALIAATRRRRIIIYAVGIFAGLAFGMCRILQGGHYLSDILFAGSVVLITSHTIHYLLFNTFKDYNIVDWVLKRGKSRT